MPTTAERVYNILQAMQRTAGLEPLKRLFWTELNYERANEPLSMRGWPEAAAEALCEPPLSLATSHGASGAFHVIYGRQRASLAISEQRPVIERLLREFPYALFIFSDYSQTRWHLVNVRYDREHGRRRVFRRITIGPNERLRTASERIAMLDLEALDGDLFGLDPLAVQTRHDEAFDVKAVTKEFFQAYKAVFDAAEAAIAGIDDPDERRLFTQKLFNRLMFIVFLERKGWLTFRGERGEYLRALWDDHRREVATDPEYSFYRDRLKHLFFSGLNTKDDVNIVGINRRGFVQRRIGEVPYLNGGLFEEDALDRDDGIRVPDEAIGRAIEELFYRYNFTVTESTPLDVEVAVDPEMLGRIFEELVTGRHETGSYYTPREIVQFMGREALKGYLAGACPREDSGALARFIDGQDPAGIRDPEGVLAALQRVRVCDPACGSGAYLLGMLHELFELRRCLFRVGQHDSADDYHRKLEIIQNNLYGVDLDPFAVNIARLRLWLSLVVEYEGDDPKPLPNLDFKIEVGNSITGPDPSGGLSADMFRQQEMATLDSLKAEYLNAHEARKRELRDEIAAQRRRVREWTGISDDEIDFDWRVDFTEVFGPAPDGNGSGFDIVITNPPYVRQEKIRDQKATLKRIYGDDYKGTADLYIYFYLRALQLLRPGGVVCFISSNKWMRAGYGVILRRALGQGACVGTVIDFGDLPVFGAIAYPCIVLATKGAPHEEHTLRALTVHDIRDVERLADVVAARAWHQLQSAMRRDGWLLARPAVQALQNKLRRAGVPLGEYMKGRIYRGIVTGLNTAFVIDRATRDRLLAEDPRSVEVIKPWLRGRDVKRWVAHSPCLFVIFIRRGVDVDLYPVVKAHLSRFRVQLEPGVEGGRKAGPYRWYEIQDSIAYHSIFDEPKIVYPDIAPGMAFAIDVDGHYSGNTTYLLPGYDLPLLAVLNSRVAEFFYRHEAAMIQGHYLRFFSQDVERIPVPCLCAGERAQLEDLVSTILNTTGRGRDVADLEDQLNSLVYEAYGLTPEEIALIEDDVARP